MNVMDKIRNHSLMTVGHRLALEIESVFPNSEALIVGGCVRDIVMGNSPKDIDIATNADIEAIAKHFHSADIGKSMDFGITLVIFEGHEFEVAHFREEFGSSDNRHPDQVNQVNDFESDTRRRDITINAMGIDTDGNVIDHQGGIEDIQNGILKAVGNASNRFVEDALRIIRIARFSARFGFEIEAETKSAMKEKVELTRNLSIERICDELFKVASSGVALAEFMKILDEIEVLGIHFPEIKNFHNFDHTPDHHPEGNLWEHIMECLRVSKSSDPLTNIAILFHDVGKTVTQNITEDGKIQYHGHEKEGAEMCVEIGKRMKMSSDDIESIRFAAAFHMVFHKMDEMKKSKIVAIRQNPNFGILKAVSRADDESRLHLFNEKDFITKTDKIEEVFRIFGEREAFEARMKPLIDGRMIIDIADKEGIKLEGVRIGAIKTAVRETVIEADFNITVEETTSMVREMVLMPVAN